MKTSDVFIKNIHIVTTTPYTSKHIECILPINGEGFIIKKNTRYVLKQSYIFFINEKDNINISNEGNIPFNVIIIRIPFELFQENQWKKILSEIIGAANNSVMYYPLSLDTYFNIKNKISSIQNIVHEEQLTILIIKSILIDIYSNVSLDKKYLGLSYKGYYKGAPWWLVKACKALENHSSLKNGYKLLVEYSGHSKEYVIRQMHRFYGMTPVQYINEIRLNRAKELLLSTKKPVYDISLMLGFENPSYFSKIFKKKYGICPNEYREAYRA